MGECVGETQLHLRWHSHATTFTTMLSDLHHGRAYTDVSLVCDGGIVRAHRAVLSLCSPYLADVLGACPDTDAPLLLPEVPVQDVLYLVSFIYRGQVDVHQQHIASFLRTAKHLHVLGLEEGDRLVDSPSKSDTSSSTSGSEAGDEPPTPQFVNGNNNNENEEEEPDEEEEEEEEEEDMSERIDVIKHEVSVKEEPSETTEAVVADVASDGRIDLNFYLQQAIQSASMPCPLCKKEFKSQSGLRDHIRLHTGERPFECEFCQMNFARASHLKRHRRMHTGEKPFMCRICGKDFSRGDKLKDHLRRHDAEDKLSKIRKQIYNPEESTQESDSETGQQAGATAPSQVLTAKSSNTTPDTALMPPAKRPRGRPPKNPQAHSQFQQQAMVQTPSLLLSQNESYVPHMLGVTSIGECILRPIN
ncbi:zinc finger and BTB domain-containing protein 14-like [Cherax quadricarinatus]|nr:zinc finger protein 37-like isoform X2 [Cherax quadricarinatus]XP_053648307.1 zinc finger protein 37-like isoform X2 [Cherax quadricarinatus]